METQKTSNSKNSLEKEKQLEESGSLTPAYCTKLQSLKQYGTGTKMELKIRETGQKAQK